MLNFDYRALPWNIVFGGASLLRLPENLDSENVILIDEVYRFYD